MTPRKKAGLLAVVAATMATFGLLSGGVHRTHDRVVDMTPKRAIQMEDEAGPEWTETRLPSADGKSDRIAIDYHNGTTGMRYLNAERKRFLEEILNNSGTLLMHADFAADGEQIIGGFRLRYCGSKQWQATANHGKRVTTLTYWYDGEHLFSEESRKISGSVVERTFYYPTGEKWMHFIGEVGGEGSPSTAEVWSKEGKPLFSHYTGLTGSSTDTGYRDDGSMAYRQTWVNANTARPEGDKSPVGKRLLKGELYNTDNSLAREFIMSDDGTGLKRVVDHEKDGKTEETSVYLGQAVYVKVYDKLGNVVAQPPLARGVLAHQVLVDAKINESHVGEFDPPAVWQKQEDRPNAIPNCQLKR